MQRLSYPTETVSSNKITRNRIVISSKDSPTKPLGRQPEERDVRGEGIIVVLNKSLRRGGGDPGSMSDRGWPLNPLLRVSSFG